MVSFGLFLPEISTQYSVDLGCKNESEAFIGLDRKEWTNDMSIISESYQINFDIPESQNFSCSVLERIEVSINGFSATNNVPSECYLWLWTHALDCDDNTPISCPDILYDQQGLSTQFEIDGEDITEGGNIGIDIVVVVDLTNMSCVQDVISAGLYDASFEICLEAFYIPDEVEEPLDLGNDIIVCEGETVNLEGPDDFEIYEWEGPIDSDEQLLENAIPGLYYLEVTDSNGCRSSDDINVEIIEMEDILFDNPAEILLCRNNPDTINVLNYSGSQFDIDWTSPSGQSGNGSEIITDSSGVYIVMVTDSDNDCTVSSTFNVTIIETTPAQIEGNDLICENGSTLLTAFIPTMDSLSYTIEWYIGQDTIPGDSLIVSEPGMIILSLTDSLQCDTSLDTINISQNTQLSAGLDNAASLCTGDSIELTTLLSPGTNQNGSWFELPSGIQLQSSILVAQSVPGSYDYLYVISNQFPCENDTALFQIVITDTDVFAGNDNNISYCPEETILLEELITGDMGGNFTFDSGTIISNTELTGSDLNTGENIIFYIIDSGSCGRDSATLTITIHEEIQETIISDILCQDEMITINNTQYDINNPSGTESMDASTGCDSIIIIDLGFHDIAENVINDELCTGDSIVVNGQTFNELNNSGTVVLPSASIFGCDSTIIIDISFAAYLDTLISYQLCETQSVMIANQVFDINNPSDQIILSNGASNGCDSIINVDLNFTNSITESLTPTICSEDGIIVNGILYNMSNPTGMEVLTASNGCDSIIDINLNFYAQSSSDIEISLCDDESFQIGNDIYNSQNLHGVSIITSGDSYGCDSIVNVLVNHGQSIETENTETICENDSIYIIDEWLSLAGNYADTLSSISGCDSIINTEIVLIVCNALLQSTITDESCFGSNDGIFEFEIMNSDLYPFEYIVEDAMTNVIDQGIINENDNVSVQGLDPGDYLCTISKDGQIVLSEPFVIIAATPITINSNITDSQCFGDNSGSITIDIVGGTGQTTILWDNGESGETISNLSAGNYSITVTDSEGCTMNENLEVNQPEDIQFDFDVVNPDCDISNNGSISITNTSGGIQPFIYSIDGTNFSSSNIFGNLGHGEYTIYLEDQNGCEQSANIILVSEDNLEITAPSMIMINQGDSVQLNLDLSFTHQTIEWTPATGLSCSNCISPFIFPLTSTNYNVVVTDVNGCQVEVEIFVDVLVPEPDIFLPNIFTPFSSDGTNSEFAPLYDVNSNIQVTSFRIFDRWGNLIFTESLNEKAWRGFINGEKAQQGIYMYAVELKDGDNEILKTGQVLLVW